METTEITVEVVDTARSASGDDVLGQVFLGSLATEKSEVDQWRNAMNNSGKEYKATHSLRLPKDSE